MRAAILTLENVVSSYTERWQTVLGLTFIVIMIFAPEGIIGTLRGIVAPRPGNKDGYKGD